MPLSPPSFDDWIFNKFPCCKWRTNTSNSYGDLTNSHLIVKQKMASILKKMAFSQKTKMKVADSRVFIRQGKIY